MRPGAQPVGDILGGIDGFYPGVEVQFPAGEEVPHCREDTSKLAGSIRWPEGLSLASSATPVLTPEVLAFAFKRKPRHRGDRDFPLNAPLGTNELPDPVDVERFLGKVSVLENGCWAFAGCTDAKGYPFFYLGKDSPILPNRMIRANRFALWLRFLRLPEGAQAAHTCNNPRCVNPMHLLFQPMSQNLGEEMLRLGIKGAALLALLIARGKISPDATVEDAEKYLHEHPSFDNRTARVRAFDTSGLPDGIKTPEEVLEYGYDGCEPDKGHGDTSFLESLIEEPAF